MAEITTDKELNLKVKLEINDLKTYYYWIERNAFFKNPINIIVLVVVALSIIQVITNEAHNNNGLIALVGIVFILARVIWKFIYINMITKKVFDSDKMIQKEQKIKITYTTITINHGESICNINWEEIHCIRESGKQFLIYTAINKSIIIPKKFFEKNEDLSLLRDIIKEAIPKEKIEINKFIR